MKNETIPIPSNMMLNSVQHKHAGNNWAVVEAYPDEWARIVSLGAEELGNQFFTVWTKKLTPDVLIKPETLTKVQEIRGRLQSGAVTIENTRLKEVSKLKKSK